MATLAGVREKLSKAINDWHEYTTVSTGTTTTILSSDYEGDDNDNFITPDHTWAYFTSGGLNGSEVKLSSKSGTTLTMAAAQLAAPGTGVTFEVSRLFSATRKNEVINRALEELYPTLFKIVSTTVTLVADQYLYDITGDSYFNDTPFQVWLQDSSDTELESIVREWSIDYAVTTGLPRLRIHFRPEAGRKLVLVGIGVPALSDITLKEEEILIAYAAWQLFSGAVNSEPGDVASRFKTSADEWQLRYERAKRVYRKRLPAIHLPTEWVRSGEWDTNFL